MALLPPTLPTQPGQRVRTTGYGSGISLWMETGTVVRFTRAGNPVVAVDSVKGQLGREVTDRYQNFRRINDNGTWLYPPQSETPTTPTPSPATPQESCVECGEDVVVLPNGVAHHVADTSDGVDHDADANHVAVPDSGYPGL